MLSLAVCSSCPRQLQAVFTCCRIWGKGWVVSDLSTCQCAAAVCKLCLYWVDVLLSAQRPHGILFCTVANKQSGVTGHLQHHS